MNEAFKISFIKSATNHQEKKRKNPTVFLQAGLLTIRCSCWPLMRLLPQSYYPKASSEMRRTPIVGILGGARTFSGPPDFLGLLTSK